MTRRTDAGVSFLNRVRSGVRSMIAAITSEAVSPSKARLPVSISNSTQPNAQMSVRLSMRLPRACSGLMYAAVPRINPSSVPCPVIVGVFP